jgi:hypothetical protein
MQSTVQISSTSFELRNSKKAEVLPVTERAHPYGCERYSLPHFLHNGLTDGGEDVSLLHTPAHYRQKILVLISVRGWVKPRASVLLEGLNELNNAITSSGIELATFRLAAYFLNQLCYRVCPYT